MWIADVTLQPPTGWVFEDPQFENRRISAGSYKDLVTAVANKRVLNGIPAGDDLEAEINLFLCSKLPPNFCQKFRGAGDIVHLFADPLAKGIDALLGTSIKRCGGCGQRRAALNEAIPL